MAGVIPFSSMICSRRVIFRKIQARRPLRPFLILTYHGGPVILLRFMESMTNKSIYFLSQTAAAIKSKQYL